MTLEILAIIIVFCLFCCYLVYRWQEAAVDMAIPPYQEPIKPEPEVEAVEPTPINPQAVWPFPGGPKP
jgi:hypothetical protein